jgi:hypothetical protein
MSLVAPFRLAVAIAATCLFVSSIQAQQPGGRGRGNFGGGGFTQSPTAEKLGYLRNEAVQKELELADDQKADLTKITDEARRAREAAGGGNFNREEFANLSEEERRKRFTEMQQRAETASKETWKKVESVLLPHQIARLQEIYVQASGVDALINDAEIAKTLAITEQQKEQLTTIRDESRRAMFSGGQGGQGGFDPQRFAAARKEREDKSLAVLNATQKEQFAKMKGEPFAEAATLRFGDRGPRQGGQGGRPGQGGQGGQQRTRPGGNNNNNNN